MDVGSVADWLSILTSAFVAGVGIFLTRKADKATARRTVVHTLTDLTSGEVEDARNLVGTLRYGSFLGSKPTEQEVTRACYRLIWAVERAGATLLAVEQLDRTVMDDARTKQLWWHLDEMLRNVELLSDALSLNDTQASGRRKEIVTALAKPDTPHTGTLQIDKGSADYVNALDTLRVTLSRLGIPVTVKGSPPHGESPGRT